MRLQATNLRLSRGGVCVLRDATMTLTPGSVTGLLGANGSGKSTLLAALAGELHPDHGHIELNGEPLSTLSARDQARQRAVLPQNPALSFDLLAHEIISAGAYPFPELAPAAVAALVHEAMASAGIAELHHANYLSLSAGQQQRVQFARVLAQIRAGAASDRSPRYLLLDEPISALDPRHQIELLRTVAGLVRQYPLGALISLHDINLAAHWCDEILLLSGGAILAHGSPQQVLTPANLRQVYEIEADVLPHPTQPGRLLILPR